MGSGRDSRHVLSLSVAPVALSVCILLGAASVPAQELPPDVQTAIAVVQTATAQAQMAGAIAVIQTHTAQAKAAPVGTAATSPVETATAQAQIESLSLGRTITRAQDGMEMVFVPAGEFQMGSTDEEVEQAWQMCKEHQPDCLREIFEVEQPAHSVVLDGFRLDQTEVTNAQYRLCVEAGTCTARLEYDDYPVNGDNQPTGVDWNQAQTYCQWVGSRLPTEAEWEYAARGPERRVYPWGDTFDGTRCNYCDRNCPQDWPDESSDDGYEVTAPVGSYPDGASWCGALDMAGNMWEWVADWYDTYPPVQEVNPTGPVAGDRKVLRGGAFTHVPSGVRGAFRFGYDPGYGSLLLGVRCASSSE